MNDYNPSQFLQQGFRIALGAITSLVETAQNPEKRAEAISELQMEFNQKTREWAIKGETTEQEARRVLDDFLRQRNQVVNDNSITKNNNTLNNFTDPSDPENLSFGIQQLKDDIVALRTELSKMPKSKE